MKITTKTAKMKSSIYRFICLLAGVACVSGAIAGLLDPAGSLDPAGPKPKETLIAYSRTALAITGDVLLSPSEITLSNGAQIPWALKESNGNVQIMAATTDANPPLLSNDTFCHQGPPRLFHVATHADGKVSLEVYADASSEEKQSRPEQAFSPCGTFVFVQK